jgi:hypothetical protein
VFTRGATGKAGGCFTDVTMFPHFGYSKSFGRRQAAKIERNHADAEQTDTDRLPTKIKIKNGSGVKELIVVIKIEIELTGLGWTV